MTGKALNEHQVEQFIDEGLIHLAHLVPSGVVAAGREVIWTDLGMSEDEPSSWTGPVVRLLPSDDRPFAVAWDNPRLHAAFDQLVGVGRWLRRPNLGLFVARFPHRADPDDTGWHIDTSFPPDGGGADDLDFSRWRVNVFSRARALLMLFLYSDVGPDDGPTRIRVGSHLDVPPLLRGAGSGGMPFAEASARAAQASASRPLALATGGAGDVYLCHPFLVHGAQAVRGLRPRLMAQPPLASREPCTLDRVDALYSPVEVAIRRGLQSGA